MTRKSLARATIDPRLPRHNPVMSGVRVVVVGLRFGSAFVPIYQRHPNVERVGICETDPAVLAEVGDRHGVEDRFARLEDVLADGRYDAVHLVTPVARHVEQTLAVLGAGKHCACAVPMATRLEDLRAIVDARRSAGRIYMMMETAVYTREYLYVKALHERGELGALTFLRGSHIQNIEGLPEYWRGYPFMLYATHAVAPILALAGTRASKVSCFGSGTLRDDLRGVYGNPFPLEIAIFRLAGTDIAAEVTGSFFQTARPYVESFSAYGDRVGFEWQQLEGEEPLLCRLEPLSPGQRGRRVTPERIDVPFRPDLLPPEIAHFTLDGGHGGSHPHLVHEFVSSIVEARPPVVDAVTAADWTAPGICAHESAMREGEPVEIPNFS